MTRSSAIPDKPDRSSLQPTVSVAVCTHNRPLQLRRALDSLLAQNVPPYEVLVVENARPNRSTEDLVRDEFAGVRYVHEPIAGLDFARNCALHNACGDVVAFLDDDAVAHRNWCGEIQEVFRANPAAGVCTGRVGALALEGAGQRLFEANGGFSRGRERICLPADASRRLHGRRAPLIAWAVSVGCGCSFAVRRELALELGGFDTALDLGAALPGGGDHDMLWRVLCAGYDMIYEPKALAWHEHRWEVLGAVDQIVGHQRALVAFLVKHLVAGRGGSRFPLAAFLLWRLLKPGVRLANRARGRDPLPARALLRMWWECLRGLVAYPRAQRLALAREVGAADALSGAG